MDYFELKEAFEKELTVYDVLFETTLDDMEFDGKLLKDALKNQINLMIQWEVISKKFNYFHDEVELLVDEAYGDAIKVNMKDKYRDVSISEAKEYAKADGAYKNARRLMNTIRHTRDECRGLLDTVQSRKYILNSMTQAIVANSERTIL